MNTENAKNTKLSFLPCISCSKNKTTDLGDLRDVSHERKRENPFNLRNLWSLYFSRLQKISSMNRNFIPENYIHLICLEVSWKLCIFALEGLKNVRQPLWADMHFLLRASLSLHSKDQRPCASLYGLTCTSFFVRA